MRRLGAFLCALACLGAAAPASLRAQTHLAVGLDSSVYTLLELLELKGILSRLSAARPYPRSAIVGYLQEASGRQDRLSPPERAILSQSLSLLTEERMGPAYGNVSYRQDGRSVAVGIEEISHLKVDAAHPGVWDMQSALRVSLFGDLGEEVSYRGLVGFTLDKADEDAWAPYEFTKEWDGTHMTTDSGSRYVSGFGPWPSLGFQLESEVEARVLGGAVTLEAGRFRREWGPGDGSLSLSGTARPFDAVAIHARLAPWLSLSKTVGSLSDWLAEREARNDPNAPSAQKMLSIGMLEVFPWDWLSVSATASAIWGKRFELGYLDPLMYSVLYQNIMGDLDNMTQAVALVLTHPGIGRLYFSFLADEMELTGPSEFFRRPNNMVAWQAGFKTALPRLPFAMLTLQYTKIEPFTYAHYDATLPMYVNPVSMSYANDGENLGYHLPPNSDEILVAFDWLALPRGRVRLRYQLVRHGDNPSAPAGAAVIRGDINHPFDWSLASSYPDKSFLRDGLYDWNNIATLSGSWDLRALPARVSASLAVAHTSWDANDSGETEPDPRWRAIMGLGLEVFRR